MARLLFSAALLLTVHAVHAGQPVADWVLTGGRVYTSDADQPWAQAVAIRGKRIVYVGDNAGATAFRGADTRTTDLGRRLVIPGLIDGHTHPGLIHHEQYDAELPLTSPEEMLAAVRAYAEAHPADDFIRLCCWPNHFYVAGNAGPHRRELDAIVPDRPVWINALAWHSSWLNTAALERLGVDEATPDPAPGVAVFHRDGNGELTGWVKEGAGWQYVRDSFGFNAEEQQPGMLDFVNALSTHGVTTVYDGGNMGYADDAYRYFKSLDDQGLLPVRYEGTFAIYLPEMRHRAVAEIQRLRATYGGKRLRFNTVKLFMDGINENRTGALLEPYIDTPEHVSRTLLSVDELRDLLIELHHNRLDLHIHTIGDLAVRRALDGVAAARAAVGDNFHPRVTFAHLEFVHPDDFPRFSELDVSANFTPWWLGSDYQEVVLKVLDENYQQRNYPLASLVRAGARLTFGSDEWALYPLNPLLGVQVGHTRRYPIEWVNTERPWEGFALPDMRAPASERLDRESLLRGYTIDGAWPFRMENEIGSIEPGKLADLVVYDENLFTIEAARLHTVQPAAVMMEGEWVHGELPGRK